MFASNIANDLRAAGAEIEGGTTLCSILLRLNPLNYSAIISESRIIHQTNSFLP